MNGIQNKTLNPEQQLCIVTVTDHPRMTLTDTQTDKQTDKTQNHSLQFTTHTLPDQQGY